MPFRKSVDSTRSTRSWFGSAAKPTRVAGPRVVEREVRARFSLSTLSSLVPWGKPRTCARGKGDRQEGLGDARQELEAPPRSSLPCRLECDRPDAIESKSSWESTCTPSFVSDRASDHGSESPVRPVCKPDNTESERARGVNADDMMDILTASQMSPRVHKALYSVLSASAEDASRSLKHDSSPSPARNSAQADRARPNASGSLSGGRRVSAFWARSTRHRTGSCGTSRVSALWRERVSQDGAGSTATASSHVSSEADTLPDVVVEPISKGFPPRVSKTQLRKSLDIVTEQNTQLRQTISQLVMDDVEITTLRKRVTELEWALDVVADDANRIRDEAFEALTNSDHRDVNRAVENKREQHVCDERDESEDE